MPLRIVLTPARTVICRSWLCMTASCAPENRPYARPDQFWAIVAVFDRVICPRESVLYSPDPLFFDHGCVWIHLIQPMIGLTPARTGICRSWPHHTPPRISLTPPGSVLPCPIRLTPPEPVFSDHGCFWTHHTPRRSVLARPDQFLPIMATPYTPTIGLTPPGPVFSDHVCV